jgi:excisionase family DNA binding protein
MSNTTTAATIKLLLTVTEAARALAIGQRKLWELTNQRVIRAVRIGRAVRYDLAELEAFIARQKGGAE